MTISRIFSVCAAALVVFACHAPALEEEIRLPEKQESVVVPERTTIPFSLQVSTEATKVSYAGGSYQFKEGDKLHVKGVTRTDIEGDLTQNGDVWSGDLSYLTSEGVPADNTALKVTLVHADNTDTESYASAIVGSDNVSEVTTANLLQYAVEHYSLFTADVTFETTSAALKQQATFLDVKVTFIFDGTHEMGSGGNARIDLVTSLGPVRSNTAFVRQSETSNRYDVHFMAVIPGGQSKDAFTLSVVDRVITFSDNATLEGNKKYTVTREIEFVPQLGDPFWNDGSYGRMDHPDENARIVGIIVYVNRDKTDEIGNAITEHTIINGEDHYGHGLVMALHNADEGVPWSNASTDKQCTGSNITRPGQTTAVNNLSGFKNTQSIIDALGEGAVSAASRAKAYGVSVPAEYTTGWFLPSVGQWMYTISTEGFGGANPSSEWINGNHKLWLENGSLNDLIYVMDNKNSSDNLLVQSLNDRLEFLKKEFGVDYDAFGMSYGDKYSDNYWSSSEGSKSTAIRMNFGSVETYNNMKWATIKVKPEPKSATWAWDNHFIMKVRPFLAF